LEAGIVNPGCGVRDPEPVQCPCLLTGTGCIILGANDHTTLVKALAAQSLWSPVKESDLFSLCRKTHCCNASCRASTDDCYAHVFASFLIFSSDEFYAIVHWHLKEISGERIYLSDPVAANLPHGHIHDLR
jgi:hypothetical protein